MLNNKMVKTLLTFIGYFLYSMLATTIINAFHISNEILVYFICDMVFLVGIVFAYKDNLKEDFINLKTKIKNDKFYLLKTILLWVVIIITFNFIMGALTDLIFKTPELDANTNAVIALKNQSLFYTIFKSMIFATFAEELLFRESVHDVVSNKWFFIIISAVIYTAMNFVFSETGAEISILNILVYFLPALIFSFAYTKNDNNILVLMLIKLAYNIIPLILMVTGV
ncbi:MAG: CPBP family glutamic-type intramembrane protease [Bacilli bacterium]